MLRRIIYSLAVVSSVSVLFANSIIHHKISVKVDPSRHYVHAVDEVTIPSDRLTPVLSFTINSNLAVSSETPGLTLKLVDHHLKPENVGMDREDFARSSDITQNKYAVTFTTEPKGDASIALTFHGTIHYPIKQMGEEYARGFSQTPGIIDEKGVYLAGSSLWIPQFDSELMSFELTATVPASWHVVSQGKRTLNEVRDGNRVVRWDSPEPMEEIYLIAAQFHEYRMAAGAVDVMAFLRTPDGSLANKYLETTAQYLQMYQSLIGPYPFTKFALVENFWETGYGMPSFTLLGEQIIRFPFILHSSYPHELLHNYWGNGVYVDFKSGNWCEGLTTYMADHLIAEQRGQGAEYRRTTLQKFKDYVTPSNDFPLNKFRSRYNAPSEAIGYGKTMMLWEMLRGKVGDGLFVKGFQKFYRDNKFKAASFDDIRVAFEPVAKTDLRQFFDQWVNRKGAPELRLSDVTAKKENDQYRLEFVLHQVQDDLPFVLDVPVAISFADRVEMKYVVMTQREQRYAMTFTAEPFVVQIDPQYTLFRKLDYNEIPPSLSRIFGSEELLILLPSRAEQSRLDYYRELADTWSRDSTNNKKIQVVLDSDIIKLPDDKNAWIFGAENLYARLVQEAIKTFDAEMTKEAVRLGKASFEINKNSFVISARHPENPASVIVLLSSDSREAAQGLARKLPHYGKYSYLVFEGTEPTNIAKGEWEAVNSPLTARVAGMQKFASVPAFTQIPKREALAKLSPVFSAERMTKSVNYLASKELGGRAPGSAGIEQAAQYIVESFRDAGLLPGADDGSYFQTWDEVINEQGNKASVKNIIGIIPGTSPAMSDESIVVCAHYDHIGLGWPGGSKANKGKIHPGADDNASGVAVMLELATLLGKTLKPQRTVVFIAFTSEESGLLGSRYYVQNKKRFPSMKIIGVLNFDTVGRLGKNKVLVLSSGSAREWRFIFMGAGYVTGVEAEMVTQDLNASDERSFIAAGIPGVQFFSGAHEDYHKPTDIAGKIDAAGMVKIATLAREAVLYLAERNEPLTFQGEKGGDQQRTRTSGERSVTTGSMPDFAFSGTGVRIAELSPGCPAEKAGLRKGDVIIQLGSHTVANLRDYSDALKTYKPGDIVELTYVRDGKENKTRIELIER